MPVMMEKKEHHGGQAMQIMKHGMLCKQYTHLPEVIAQQKSRDQAARDLRPG
jgi:hypothetical protein